VCTVRSFLSLLLRMGSTRRLDGLEERSKKIPGIKLFLRFFRVGANGHVADDPAFHFLEGC